jgi:type IV secretory pathway TraG/TraD family ATPase VirD4
VLDATDIQGAEYVSNMCGDLEVLSENRSMNWQTDNNRGVGFGSGVNQSSKKLMTPANVRELRADEAILFIKSLRGIPLKVTRKPYWKTTHGAAAQPNPFYHGGK